MGTTLQVKQQPLGPHAVLAIVPDHPDPEDRFLVFDTQDAATEWLRVALAKHGGSGYVVPLALVLRGGEPKPQEIFPIGD